MKGKLREMYFEIPIKIISTSCNMTKIQFEKESYC